jgi:hypothetical protein
MFFDIDLTTPASTTKEAPLVTTLPIIRGRITQVVVFVPPGSAGLTHLQVRWGLYQLFPSNQDGDFSASGSSLAWAEDILIDHDPAALTLVTWNDDDTYEHTIHFSVALLPAVASPTIEQVIAALQTQQQPTPPGV